MTDETNKSSGYAYGGGRVTESIPVSEGSRQGDVPQTSSYGASVGETLVGENQEQESVKVQPKETEEVDRYTQLEIVSQESVKKNLLSFNGLKIKGYYPNAFQKLFDYICEKTDIPDLINEDTTLGILLYSPAIVIFDFFDQNKLFVNICGKEEDWYYSINSTNISIVSAQYKNRTLTEEAAFNTLFEKLENQLTKNLKT